jgi:hypothetical protein
MSEKKGTWLNGADEIKGFEHLESIDVISETIINEIDAELFIPNWNNKPPYKPPIITLGKESVLSFQNITTIIAQPGAGKSSVMESIASAIINKETADNLGFETSAQSILFIDFERTHTDVWNSFSRTMKRAKVEQGTNIENIDIVSFRNISTAEKRKEKIEEILKNKRFDILLLDGIGDLVSDTNSLFEAIECKSWVRYITSTYNVSVFSSLHPNKGSNTPRGHIGSEMMRESENVLLIEVDADGTRTITSDFAHGKSRNGKHVNSSFIWNDELKMFVTAEFEVKERKVKEAPQNKFEHQELINLTSITHSKKLTASESIEKLTNYLKTTVSYVKTDNNSIKSFLRYLEDNNYLLSSKDEKDKRTTYYTRNESKV